ncbi:hypothetical protein [Halobellus ordinarius]|uniref:hypothetical protein n=1 Tax=Halobellus ordinarius TaxID=3075120 RepID=UPI00288015E8|nr:hypothetical protein [Halobellus sp. ZY16]
MTETVRACPDCGEVTDIFRRMPGKGASHHDERAPNWRCSACGAEFDEPDEREKRAEAPPITGPAAALVEASAEDVPGGAD